LKSLRNDLIIKPMMAANTMSRFVHLIELADAMLQGEWSIELVQNVKKIPR